MSRRLPALLDRLEREAGPAPQPPVTDPLGLILWENVAYLVDDERRALAFNTLKKRVGLSAAKILEAPEEVLLDIAALGGMHPGQRVDRLRTVASLAMEVAQGDLRKVIDLPWPQAKKVLKPFPGIGDPGAEKILLFAGKQPILAMDSNALRVLLRLGYGEDDRNYAKSYRSAQTAASAELYDRCPALVRATTLLRRHGQGICRRSDPECARCPLTSACTWFRANR